jgi:hypothetical protein
MFKTVQLVSPSNPVVIDVDDLLANPRDMMERFCAATGLPFQENMLTWTPGIVTDWTEFTYYKVWHGTAMMSSGFIKPSPLAAEVPATAHPQEIEDVIQRGLPFYEAMYAMRMRPNLNS